MKTRRLKAVCGLIAVWFLLASSSLAATTYYVGTCHKPSYATISAAVAAAAPGSIVDVCPGTYPEQVFIMQALTLQGIRNSNKGRARITAPIPASGGPPQWTFVPDPDTPGVNVAPQIYVNSPAGAVTIKDLTIDGSGETTAIACFTSGYWETTAIFLENSSGTITGVNTVGQGKNSGCGDGIRAFVAGAGPDTLTLTDSSLQDAHQSGLILEGAGLTVSVSGNVLDLTSNNYGISSGNASGTISSNFLTAEGDLIYDYGSGGSITYSGNVLRGINTGTTNCSAGMLLERAAQVTGNKIDGCLYGIYFESLATNTVSLKNNLVVNTALGLGLGCDSNVTLAGNTVNNSVEGVDSAPNPVSTAEITFDNVDTVKTGTCP